ncbi:hypothetical protein HNR42_000331 [Deinobacterium chartae]|uniref:Uncharacterized protein n=1 Tax=Deinobacterium chartae TaxID=521158 RepID=A0A841HXE9_9DEIO|nr:hypothetical protein [Deinobacterium chartae]MBB6096919.1 hypothetical protein [Deinobacterium chartae]
MDDRSKSRLSAALEARRRRLEEEGSGDLRIYSQQQRYQRVRRMLEDAVIPGMQAVGEYLRECGHDYALDLPESTPQAHSLTVRFYAFLDAGEGNLCRSRVRSPCLNFRADLVTGTFSLTTLYPPSRNPARPTQEFKQLDRHDITRDLITQETVAFVERIA